MRKDAFIWPSPTDASTSSNYENPNYLVDLLELRADVLLLPQTLTEAPVRRGKEELVWMWNTETGRPRYNRNYASMMFWKCSLTPVVWHEPWPPPPARTSPPRSLSYLHFYYNKRNACSYFIGNLKKKRRCLTLTRHTALNSERSPPSYLELKHHSVVGVLQSGNSEPKAPP